MKVQYQPKMQIPCCMRVDGYLNGLSIVTIDCSIGVVVITSAQHADGPRFDPWIEHIFIILISAINLIFFIYEPSTSKPFPSMILKKVITSIRHVSTSFRAYFASQHPKDPKPSEGDSPKITKFNPLRQKDLRGFENFDKLNQNQKSYSPIHSKQYQALSAYGVCSLLSNNMVRWISRWVPNPKSAITSESQNLPRIYADSVPIYDSIEKAPTYIVINKIVTQFVPFSILFFSAQPALALLTYGLLYYVYYGTNWKTARHLVVKMEYLPHLEELAYMKVSFWGKITTNKIKRNDLELTNLSEIYGENSYSEKSARGLYNRDVAFRNKITNEIFLFDKHGIWNEEGINHPQLI